MATTTAINRNVNLKRAALAAKHANLMEMQMRIGVLVDGLICKLDEIDETLAALQSQIDLMGVDIVYLRQGSH